MKKKLPLQHLAVFASIILLLAVLTASCNTNTDSAAPSDAATATPPPPVDAQKLMAPFAPPTQTFRVSGKKPSTVRGKAGTVLHIVPKNLSHADGSPIQGKIEVSLIECTSKSEIIGAGLQTVSNGRLLESGGSYFIGMKADGQELRIAQGKEMQVEFPQLSAKDMELFYGEKSAEGIVNWVPANEDFEVPVVMDSSTAEVAITTDTIYQYISGSDTLQSTTMDDIWAFIEEESNKPDAKKKMREARNQEAMMARRAKAEQKNSQQTQDPNVAAMMARRNGVQSSQQAEQAGIRNKSVYEAIGLNRLGWINCDRYYGQPTSAVIAMTADPTAGQLMGYIIFRDQNTSIQCWEVQPGKLAPESLPKGEEVEFICLSERGNSGNYAFAAQKLTVTEDATIQMDLKPATADEIRKVLASL